MAIHEHAPLAGPCPKCVVVVANGMGHACSDVPPEDKRFTVTRVLSAEHLASMAEYLKQRAVIED